MAKAILVMDMPESCDMCDFVDDEQPPRYGEKTLYCGVPGIGEDVTDYIGCRPDSCPLRELPEKANHPAYCDNGRFDKGWNACLDMILEKKVNENVMPGTRNEKRTEGAQENEKRK